MKVNKMKRHYLIWGLVSIIITICWFFIITLRIETYHDHKKIFLDTELKTFAREVNATLTTYELFSNYIYGEINNTEDILSIISESNLASKQVKDSLRSELYEQLVDKYMNMEKYNFRQFHFHLKNTESFLRMHTPNKYGDLLGDVRESVRLVNEEKKYIKGFEEGRIYNGFRYVYPLEYLGSHIGSVEISVSSASILETLSVLYPQEDFYFIIDKSAVDEKVFESEKTNYTISQISDQFYMDTEVKKITDAYKSFVIENDHLIWAELQDKDKDSLMEHLSFSRAYSFSDEEYIVKFLSIENFKNEPVAYLISISQITEYLDLTKEFKREIFLDTFLALTIISIGLIVTIYQSKLKHTSEVDHLTQLYNRHKFYELAEKEIIHSRRYDDELSIVMLDIDHFKNINDTYGHEWGDKVLKELTKLVAVNIRKEDIFSRWGGEEFVLLLPHTNLEKAYEFSEKIRCIIQEADTKALKGVSVSIGVACVDVSKNIDYAINLADSAMYLAKENGRNQVEISKKSGGEKND